MAIIAAMYTVVYAFGCQMSTVRSACFRKSGYTTVTPTPGWGKVLMPSIVEMRKLTRRFADAVAVDRLGFAVRQGEVFGLLGPNGAGKTTTVRMLTGYLPPTEGTVVVAGHDLRREPNEARQHLAVVREEANAYVDLIRVGFGEAHYFALPARLARRRSSWGDRRAPRCPSRKRLLLPAELAGGADPGRSHEIGRAHGLRPERAV
jgi:hypothetical protein